MTGEVIDRMTRGGDDQRMTDNLIAALMLVVAAIHLVPITGVLSAARLVALYGVELNDPDLEILMRHRAVLFGILGAFFAYAAFTPTAQPLAFIAAALSLASFFYLASSVGDYGPPIRRIVIGDVVAAICLAGAIVLYVGKGGAEPAQATSTTDFRVEGSNPAELGGSQRGSMSPSRGTRSATLARCRHAGG